MLENEEREQPLTSEDHKRELFEYLKDAEFGTPKFLALADRLNFYVHAEIIDAARDCLSRDLGNRGRIESESQLRIEEFEMALLEHRIEERRSTMRGYGAAYTHIAAAVDDYSNLLSVEAKANILAGEHKEDKIDKLNSDLWKTYYEKEGK